MTTSYENKALRGELYIGGEWRESNSGKRFPVIDPGKAAELATVADGSIEDGIAAVDAAEAAAGAWAATAPRERGEILRRAFELMIERRDELAKLITLENGKTLTDSLGEINYAAEFLRWFSEEAVRANGALLTAPNGQYNIMTRLQPVGISLFVTPWNFPAAMATRKIGPALAAGCTVVVKPAAETPLTMLAMADIFEAAGVPGGVINMITTSTSSKVVGGIMADPRLRKISFTGSTSVGQVLLKQAADNVLRTSMELGGNAPFLVLADADLDVAVSSAMVAKLRNGGQACTAANRFYVHASVKEEFCQKLAAAFGKLKTGYGLDDGVDIGAMINAKAREDVLELVEDAVDRGAKVIAGGGAPDAAGFFLEPTLLQDVAYDARTMSEEIFGPVAPIATFEDVDDAIAAANSVEVGLVSYVMSGDLNKALAVSEALESGMVGINRGVVSDPAAPFGGWKQSGLGREGGHEGLLEYLETKYIAASW